MRFTFEVIIDIPRTEDQADGWSRELARELRGAVIKLTQITPDSLTQVRELGYRPSDPLNPGRTICAHCGKEVEGDPLLHQCSEKDAARRLIERETDPTKPHLFRMNGHGTPDRPCTLCDRPDRDPIHAIEISPATSSALVKSPGAELEAGIEIDARFKAMVETMKRKPRFGTCAACLERIEISDDPLQTHHIIMRHKAEACKASPSMKWSSEEYGRAVAEFEAQPHVIEMRRNIEKAHAAESKGSQARERNLSARVRDSFDQFMKVWKR